MKMVNTNSKEFREKVQAHIRTQLRGKGGVTKIVEDIDSYTRPFGNGRRISVSGAAEMMLDAPDFLFTYYDINRQLHKWGLTDDKRIQQFRGYGGGEWGLYKALMISNIVRMYEDAKKPKKIVKKKTLRRK
jgi:hypothetical protein